MCRFLINMTINLQLCCFYNYHSRIDPFNKVTVIMLTISCLMNEHLPWIMKNNMTDGAYFEVLIHFVTIDFTLQTSQGRTYRSWAVLKL
ncbi:hypothetical protein T4D_5853 [Trichinella pseudospiralis]|uniref:Uncharacterized protein n=1 Tax=Trichinella pseudospiralis TaxID=6337 RepID=A0A0V1FIC0_TRIPS|nr:hypothetical protein T4D_5853 [Trichinella pseudospiralis]